MTCIAYFRRRLVGPLMIFGVTLALPVLGSAGAASATTPTCFGQTATIVASPSERIEGTPGPDVIVGRAGDEIIFGGGGNDLICGRAGSDLIDGGEATIGSPASAARTSSPASKETTSWLVAPVRTA